MANVWDLVVRVLGNSSQFREDIERDKLEVREMADEIDGKKAELKVSADTAAVIAKLDEVKAKLDELPNKKTIDVETKQSGDAGGGMGLLGSSILSFLPTLAPLAATATGAMLGLSASFAAAETGAVGFAAVAKTNLSPVFDAVNKQGKAAQEAWNSLDAKQRQAANSLKQFESFWQSFAKQFENPVLNVFINGLQFLQAALRQLSPIITSAGNAFAELFREMTNAFNNDAAVKNFFKFVAQDAGPAILAFGRSVGNVLKGIMSLMTGFAPLAVSMQNGLVGLTQRFAQWAQSVTQTKGFHDFIQYVQQNGPKILSIIGQLATLAGHLLVAMAPLGAATLTVINNFLKWVNAITTAHPQLLTLIAAVLQGIGIFKLVAPVISGVVSAFRMATTAFNIAKIAIAALGGPWSLLIAAIVAGVVLIVTHWQQISEWAKKIWNDVKDAFSHLGEDIKNIWNGIVSWFDGLWSRISSFFGKWGPEILTIIAPFLGLPLVVYQHWNQIVGWLRNVWNTVKADASSVWNSIRSALSSIWSSVVSGAEHIFGPIVSWFSHTWSSIESAVSSAWSRIRSSISSGASAAFNAITSIFGRLGSFFSRLWGQAEQWGSNLIHMVAQGIENAAGAVANAVSGVANRIKSFLGFHSPTEEGPASDSDEWMPNMMNMFIEGIKAKTPDLHATLANAITPPQFQVSGSVARMMGVGSMGAAAVGSYVHNGPLVSIAQVNTNNQQDIQKLQRAIYDANAAVLRAQGVRK